MHSRREHKVVKDFCRSVPRGVGSGTMGMNMIKIHFLYALRYYDKKIS